jgi:murein L,D-transpeptidase YcbB/YkuD
MEANVVASKGKEWNHFLFKNNSINRGSLGWYYLGEILQTLCSPSRHEMQRYYKLATKHSKYKTASALSESIQSALNAFQREYGIDEGGYAGPQTVARLKTLLDIEKNQRIIYL